MKIVNQITAAAINKYLKFTDPHLRYIIDEKSFNDLQSNKINDIKKSSLVSSGDAFRKQAVLACFERKSR
ncbi:MAG: hypothetical protein IPK68_22060 [Bdellovibrionales bacterium]|nr:hypothetical protein [Bdellovibrionales bacterium]